MNSLERSKQEISQLVESRTSYGFWIFFLFFQVSKDINELLLKTNVSDLSFLSGLFRNCICVVEKSERRS
jgi:hypothetical protein